MPLGLDTPSTFGTVFLIIGPAYQAALQRGLDAESAARMPGFWASRCSLASGFFKLACAPWSGWIRRQVPRAGLLGSLTAIALVLISFLAVAGHCGGAGGGSGGAGADAGDVDGALAVSRAISRARLGRWWSGCLVYYGMHLLGWARAWEARG